MRNENDIDTDVLIAGGSVAGLSAALMLGRAGRRVTIVDAGSPRNRFAGHMHGLLGNEGTPPTELLARGRAEVAAYGVAQREGVVERVTEQAHGVSVDLADRTTLTARALVVATGMTDRLPDIPGLAEHWGKTVLHCPYCHGYEVRARRLAVLATPAVGLHQAFLVRQWSESVTVFTAALGELDEATVHRLRSRGVRLIPSPVVEVVGDGESVTGVRTEDGEVTALDAIFTASAPEPHDAFLRRLPLERTMTPLGEFLAVDAGGRTSSPRIWAAGNVTNPGATVPVSIAAGSTAGGTVNMALVEEDFDTAQGERR